MNIQLMVRATALFLVVLVITTGCALGGKGGRDGGDATIEATVGDLPECASVTGDVECKNTDGTTTTTTTTSAAAAAE